MFVWKPCSNHKQHSNFTWVLATILMHWCLVLLARALQEIRCRRGAQTQSANQLTLVHAAVTHTHGLLSHLDLHIRVLRSHHLRVPQVRCLHHTHTQRRLWFLSHGNPLERNHKISANKKGGEGRTHGNWSHTHTHESHNLGHCVYRSISLLQSLGIVKRSHS